MRKTICPILLAMIAVFAVSVGARESESTLIKEQIVKLLARISMKLNYAIDEKFCRQFFEDFKKQKE